MNTFVFQVPKEVYNDFIEYLDAKNLVFEKVSEFTPIGQWCLVKCVGPLKECEKANEYLDSLL